VRIRDLRSLRHGSEILAGLWSHTGARARLLAGHTISLAGHTISLAGHTISLAGHTISLAGHTISAQLPGRFGAFMPPPWPGWRHDLPGDRALTRDHDKLPVTGAADRE